MKQPTTVLLDEAQRARIEEARQELTRRAGVPLTRGATIRSLLETGIGALLGRPPRVEIAAPAHPLDVTPRSAS